MSTVGQYLASRLQQIGIKDYFAIPGDYNMPLLDELLLNENLNMINCCNELNAGYAADGYCRANGVAAMVVTFSVGGLSAINAVAGAYAEDLPVIIVSCGPNTNSAIAHQILHHTMGEQDYRYVRDMFAKVTVKSVIIDNIQAAAYLMDDAINAALTLQKPVYIEIACNLSNCSIAPPQPLGFLNSAKSDSLALQAAVESAATMLNNAKKPTLVAGVKLRPAKAFAAMQTLIDASGYGVAAMPTAKGFIDETQESYMGIYWGAISSPSCANIVESSDAYLFAGTVLTDYSTTGYSMVLNAQKLIVANFDHVVVAGVTFNQVFLAEFLTELAKQITRNTTSCEAFKRIQGEAEMYQAAADADPIVIRNLFARIEKMLDFNSSVIVDTGDSWFNGARLHLPKACTYEVQMQYGSIGWSVGATFGYSLATKNKRRVISCIGDGAFQMTAQEVASMIRYQVNPIIFLINNGSYTIEEEIHDGEYNILKNWQYSELIKVFNAEDGHAWACQVRTEAELANAIQYSLENTHKLCFIEVMIDRNDCNKNLLEWGAHVAVNNSLSPK
ncbi:MAG: thiamine pyrophosphate-binding protein [Pseudomonadota bacterium]